MSLTDKIYTSVTQRIKDHFNHYLPDKNSLTPMYMRHIKFFIFFYALLCFLLESNVLIIIKNISLYFSLNYHAINYENIQICIIIVSSLLFISAFFINLKSFIIFIIVIYLLYKLITNFLEYYDFSKLEK